MQVSFVCPRTFSATDTFEPETNSTTGANSNTVKSTFMSTPKKIDLAAEMNSIFEWKTFCQNQIAANNLDYIA